MLCFSGFSTEGVIDAVSDVFTGVVAVADVAAVAGAAADQHTVPAKSSLPGITSSL